MAKRRKKRSRRSTSSVSGGGSSTTYKRRRDWSKIIFYTFSILIVLSMVVSAFAGLLSAG